MSIRAFAMLVCTLLLAQPLAAETIPFEICAESTTWTRPTPEVQAKVWNDRRWRNFARSAYAWTHNFILVDDPASGSITGMIKDLSGLWTAQPETVNPKDNPKCDPGQSPFDVIAIWAMLHRVTQVTHDAGTYTITVEPTGRGFQSVFIRRLNPKAVLSFVTPDGKELETWDESERPDKETFPGINGR